MPHRAACCARSIAAAVVAVAVIIAAPATASDQVLPDRSIGAPPACGDLSVASLMEAECLVVDEASGEEADAAPMTVAGPAISASAADGLATASAAPSTFAASCRYDANVVFYAQNEWVTVGRTLAANSSPCAEYWIHIPTLAANKLA